MSTATNPSKPSGMKPVIEMAVSAYDRVASWLVALIIVVGFFVFLMFLMWLTSVLEFAPKQVEVVLVENIAGRGDHAKGYERDVEAPGVEELEEIMEPQVEQLLEAVTDLVSTQAASLDAMQTDATSSNVGDGVGDSRPPGPLGEGDNIIPRWERWQIRYNTSTVDAYARQLDFFKIELGAVGGGISHVDYATRLSGTPKTRKGPGGDAEKRLYMTWASGTLRQYDKTLLAGARIKTRGRILMQFYPKNVENQLALLEKAYWEKRGKTSVKQIKRTIFGVRRRGSRYEYYVVSQAYRVVPT